MNKLELYKSLQKLYGGINRTANAAGVTRNTVSNCLQNKRSSKKEADIIQAAKLVIIEEAEKRAALARANREKLAAMLASI